MKFGVREICDVVFKAKDTVVKQLSKKVNQFYISIVQKLLLLKEQLLLYMLKVEKVIQD